MLGSFLSVNLIKVMYLSKTVCSTELLRICRNLNTFSVRNKYIEFDKMGDTFIEKIFLKLKRGLQFRFCP